MPIINLLNEWGATARAAVPGLTEILVRDANVEVREAAAGALGMIGPTENQEPTVSALVSSLRSESWRLRQLSAAALSRIDAAVEIELIDKSHSSAGCQ